MYIYLLDEKKSTSRICSVQEVYIFTTGSSAFAGYKIVLSIYNVTATYLTIDEHIATLS
jgi:hypothetical protein